MHPIKVMLLVVAAVIASAGDAQCQAPDDFELSLFRPRLEIAADSFPNRSFQKTNDEYGSDSLLLSFNVPLGSTHLRPGKRILGYQFLAQARLWSGSPEISFLQEDRRLYVGGVAVTSLMLGSEQNLYVASIGASAAEDDRTKSDPSARFYGFGLGTHRFANDKVALAYGGAFTHLYGRGQLLPIVGVIWTINPKWTLVGLPPFVVIANYRATDAVRVGIRTGPAGNNFRFSNQGEFPGQDETIFLHLVHWRTTGEIEWKVSDDVSLLVRAGITRTTKFAFSDDSRGRDPFREDKTDPAPYLRLAARFTFGKTLLEKWEEP